MHAVAAGVEPKNDSCGCTRSGSCSCASGPTAIDRHAHGPWRPPTAAAAAVLARSGEPMPSALRSRFEGSFGHDLSAVRLHTDPLAAAAADQLNADAWTSGNHIVMGVGQFGPGCAGADRLLAHELTHVVQQRTAPARPAFGGDDAGAEAHADQVAARVIAGANAGPIPAVAAVGIARKPRKSSVTSIDVNGATKRITFHGPRPHSWELTDFDLDNGDYTATVHLQYTPTSKLTLELQNAIKGQRFQFRYAIMATDADPMTLVNEGQVVHVHATADPSAGARPVPADDQREVRFSVQVIGEGDFEAITGRSAAELPEGTLVDGSSFTWINAGAGFGAMKARYPFPTNTTGVMWTGQHMSDVAVVDGVPMVRGFRAPFSMHMTSYLERKDWFGGAGGDATYQLNAGTPGTYANDYWYMYQPGATLVHRGPIDPRVAETGAIIIDSAAERFNTPYRFSPPPIGDGPAYTRLSGGNPAYVCQPGQNCINVPIEQHEAMLGGRKMTVNPSAPVDIATGNSINTGEPYTFTRPNGTTYSGPGYAENAKQWVGAVEDRAAEGLTVTPIAKGMAVRGVLRTGGRVLLIYGVYESIKRIAEASPEDVPAVVVEEGGTWLGGMVGSALTSAAAGAVVCSETGPGAVICSAAFGVVGGFAGAIFGRNVADEFVESLAGIGPLLRDPVRFSNTATLMFGTPEQKKLMWDFQRLQREMDGVAEDGFDDGF